MTVDEEKIKEGCFYKLPDKTLIKIVGNDSIANIKYKIGDKEEEFSDGKVMYFQPSYDEFLSKKFKMKFAGITKDGQQTEWQTYSLVIEPEK